MSDMPERLRLEPHMGAYLRASDSGTEYVREDIHAATLARAEAAERERDAAFAHAETAESNDSRIVAAIERASWTIAAAVLCAIDETTNQHGALEWAKYLWQESGE